MFRLSKPQAISDDTIFSSTMQRLIAKSNFCHTGFLQRHSWYLKGSITFTNDTFTKFSIKGSKLQTILLESFASFMSTIRVSHVNEDALDQAAISIEDFEQVGLNLSWLKQNLDEVKRVNKHSESVKI
ncbi:hypothetical protein ACSBR2_007114 [Camellia fascicularis]